ncbi:MAG: aminotransferase class IV [Clostridiales bacterium]|nr:aminotransferase class IV [Clostridiales bacterium]
MAYPLVEGNIGKYCVLNGLKVDFNSIEGQELFIPTEEITYYESIRFQEGVLLFWADHMERLRKSVEAKENFPIDPDSYRFLAESLIWDSGMANGNIRVVLTKSLNLIYLSNMTYPTEEMYRDGIVTRSLTWERVEPHVKVFRGDYKKAVAEAQSTPTSFGMPYEVILRGNDGKFVEGGRSNFFVLHENTVYSPSEDLILIGITRKYVKDAITEAGLLLKEGSFTMEELVKMEKEEDDGPPKMGLFVTSSPFDILPVASIDDVKFRSASCPALQNLMASYQKIVHEYIATHAHVDSF